MKGWKRVDESVQVPVQKPAEEHGELGPDDRHHRRGDEVGCRENAIDDGHAARGRAVRHLALIDGFLKFEATRSAQNQTLQPPQKKNERFRFLLTALQRFPPISCFQGCASVNVMH